MLSALGALLPYAVPVALSPLPIIAVVMLLLGRAGVAGGFGLLAGRLVALAVLSLIVAALSGRLAEDADASEVNGWLRIGIGCLLLVGAALVWSKRPRQGQPPKLPGWIQSVENTSPVGALSLGLILTVANLKELAFIIGAGVLIGTSDLPTGQAVLLVVVFACLASLSVAIPVIWSLASPAGSQAALTRLRDWLAQNNSIVMAAILLVIGAMLIGDGLAVL